MPRLYKQDDRSRRRSNSKRNSPNKNTDVNTTITSSDNSTNSANSSKNGIMESPTRSSPRKRTTSTSGDNVGSVPSSTSQSTSEVMETKRGNVSRSRKQKSAPKPYIETKRFGIRIDPSSKTNDDNDNVGETTVDGDGVDHNNDKNNKVFGDDKAYWEAARLASSTLLTQPDDNQINKGDNDDEEEDSLRMTRSKKQQKKKEEIQQLKQQYDRHISEMGQPNFNIGSKQAGNKSGSGQDEGSEEDTTIDKLLAKSKSKLQTNPTTPNIRFSPSEMSRVSTIPPTPASMRSEPFSSIKLAANRKGDAIGGINSIDENDFDAGDDLFPGSIDDNYDDNQKAPSFMSPSLKQDKAGAVATPPSMEGNLTEMLNKTFGGETPGAEVEQDDDDDDDGHGFELATDGDQDIQSASSSSKSATKSILRNKTSKNVEDNEDEAPKAKPKKKRSTKRVRIDPTSEAMGYPAGNREYKTIPVDEFESRDFDDENVRRSKRRKFPPLAYWKNERVIYEANDATGVLAEVFGDMPVVSGVLTAEPTPYKKRKAPIIRKKKVEEDDDEDVYEGTNKKNIKVKEVEPFDYSKLHKKFNVMEGQTALVWNEAEGKVEERKLFAYSEDLVGHQLPTTKRSKGESNVFGLAAQAFNVPSDSSTLMPGYITGNLVLPPKGIKDAEGVGICAQVFNIGDCQPKSIEVAIADPDYNDGKFESKTAQRFFLSKGEMFHVPPGNIYRIENHSKKTKCTLFWTIIRPMKQRVQT